MCSKIKRNFTFRYNVAQARHSVDWTYYDGCWCWCSIYLLVGSPVDIQPVSYIANHDCLVHRLLHPFVLYSQDKRATQGDEIQLSFTIPHLLIFVHDTIIPIINYLQIMSIPFSNNIYENMPTFFHTCSRYILVVSILAMYKFIIYLKIHHLKPKRGKINVKLSHSWII